MFLLKYKYFYMIKINPNFNFDGNYYDKNNYFIVAVEANFMHYNIPDY